MSPENQLYNNSGKSGDVIPDVEHRTLEIVDPKTKKVLSVYPLPDKFDVVNGNIKDGQYIGITLNTASAGLALDKMIKIILARKVMPDEGLSKNIINLAPCYAPVDGVIRYDFEKQVFFIGDTYMGPIHPKAVYYFPHKTKVKKFDRISSDPADIQWYFTNNIPIDDVYFMFRKQFKDEDSVGDGLLGDNLTEELLETMFHLLAHKNFKTGKHEWLGVRKGITQNNTSFFAQLSYSHGKTAISKLASGDLKFEDDVFTRNILDHMIMSSK